MAKAIDGNGDGIGSELGKIKEDINLNQIGRDVREVQKAGRDDVRKPVAVPKSNASKSAGKSVATLAKKKQAGTSTPAKQKKA
jgi:hypothetical protein